MIQKRGNVFFTFTERGEAQTNTVQAEIELPAESPRFDFSLQISGRGGNETNKGLLSGVEALAVRQVRNQFALAGRIQFLDIIQIESAAGIRGRGRRE